MDALAARTAAIVSTWIGIVTIDRRSIDAIAVNTVLSRGTGVPIITGGLDECIEATGFLGAEVIGALVVIVTVEGSSWQTRTEAATVVGGARVAVVTRLGVEEMYATLSGVAAVVSADIPIVAVKGLARHTFSGRAKVSGGAGVPIGAGRFVGCELAAVRGVARVICAGIVVGAERCDSGLTHTFQAVVSYGTCIGIIAGESFMGRTNVATS